MTEAESIARIRDLLPTTLGTQEIRDAIAADLRARSVFSARVANARFLDAIKFVVDEMAGGRTNMADARWYLGEVLKEIGYTPEAGFPDTPPGEVPEAMAGTLQDLSSKRRLELIIRTQTDLMRGRGQQLRGTQPERLEQFPAWELVRVGFVEVPRDWPSRWAIAGGVASRGRLVALKGDPLWGELGGSGNFDDALDVDYPPFAFNSGMGWREVPREECRRLGVTGPNGESIDEWLAGDHPTLMDTQSGIPAPQASVKNLDPAIRKAFEKSAGIEIVEDTATTKGNADEVRAAIERRRAERAARREARGEAWQRRNLAEVEGGNP